LFSSVFSGAASQFGVLSTKTGDSIMTFNLAKKLFVTFLTFDNNCKKWRRKTKRQF
jgi:hypothetical protein